jgi:hypothetical protein
MYVDDQWTTSEQRVYECDPNLWRQGTKGSNQEA